MNRLTRSKTLLPKDFTKKDLNVFDGKITDINKSKLPKNFFEQMMDLEFELSIEFNKDKLTSLLELYSTAIQYYSIKEPSKVKGFHERMEKNLTKKDTLSNLSKFNLNKIYEDEEDNEIGSKSSHQLTTVKERGRARTIKFKEAKKVKNLQSDTIKKNVKIFIEDTIALINIDKKNIKSIVNKDLKKQRKNWIEKFNKKIALINSKNALKKSISTPNPMETRNSLDLEYRKKLGKSVKHLPKYPKIDDESSENDDKSNENDLDFLKLYKEIEGEKSRKSNSNSNSSRDSDNEDDDSIIGNDYQDYDINKIDEDENNNKVQENNINKNSSNNIIKDISKNSTIDVIKEIDENEENDENNNNNKNNRDLNTIKNCFELMNNTKEDKKSDSSKYLTKYKLPKIDEDVKNKKEIHPPEIENKEKNEIKENKEKNDIKEDKESFSSSESDSSEEKNETKEKVPEIPKSIPAVRRKSIDDVDVIRKIELDEEIKKIVNEKMKYLGDTLNDVNYSGNDSNLPSSVSLPNLSKKIDIEEIPLKYQPTFLKIDEKMKEHVGTINTYYYKEIFENFSLKLKQLYDDKYNQYLKVNKEYHSNILENQFILETVDNLDEKEKIRIQNIIESLKEEEKDQIDKIIDEYNNNINNLISDFKQNSIKKNIGIQLIEEQLKLDIITMINDSFYK